MATLGDLIINIKVTGDREALAAIGRINQQAQQSSTAFRAGAASASGYFNTLNNGAFNATRSLMNMSGQVKVGNDNLSQLIQNLSAVKILFGSAFKFDFPKLPKFGDLRFQMGALARDFGRAVSDELNNAVRLVQSGERTPRTDAISSLFGLTPFPADLQKLFDDLQTASRGNLKTQIQGFANFAREFTTLFSTVNSSMGGINEPFTGPITKNLANWMQKFGTQFNILSNNSILSNFKIGLLNVSNAIGTVQHKLGTFGNVLNNKLGNVFPVIGQALGALIQQTIQYYKIVWSFAVPAFTALTMAASQAAANMQKMKTQMQAILMGNGMGREAAMGRAGTMMTGFRAISEPSIFTSQQLFEASSRLEAFGINTFAKFGAKGEPVLQIMVKLAEVFGGMPDDLEMVVRMFGRMAAGDLPDIEVLSRFGISKADLNKAGGGNLINMATGKLAGTPQQGVEALLTLINQRYSELFELQKNNITAKIASLQEKFGELLVKIGEPINKALAPIIENISKFMDQLIASGTAEMIGKAFADIINIFNNPKVFESFKSLVINITAAVIQATMEFAKFTVVLMGISDMIVGIGKGFVALTKGDFEGAKRAGKEISRGFSLAIDPMQGKGGRFGSAVQPWPMQMLNNFEQANALQKQLLNKGQTEDKKKALDELGKGPLLKKLLDGTEQQNSQLDTIASNTGRAADALDLRKANLGGRGGALAQIGMGVNAGSDPVGITRAALPPSFALLNPVNQLQKSIQMEVFRTTNANYLRRY